MMKQSLSTRKRISNFPMTDTSINRLGIRSDFRYILQVSQRQCYKIFMYQCIHNCVTSATLFQLRTRKNFYVFTITYEELFLAKSDMTTPKK
jgi:hypothetical protein